MKLILFYLFLFVSTFASSQIEVTKLTNKKIEFRVINTQGDTMYFSNINRVSVIPKPNLRTIYLNKKIINLKSDTLTLLFNDSSINSGADNPVLKDEGILDRFLHIRQNEAIMFRFKMKNKVKFKILHISFSSKKGTSGKLLTQDLYFIKPVQ